MSFQIHFQYTVEFQDFAATPIRMQKCACAVWFAQMGGAVMQTCATTLEVLTPGLDLPWPDHGRLWSS